MKKKRLFVRSPDSDGQWWYCGGPEIDDAAKGLANTIRCDLEALMRGELEGEPEFELDVREMTDEEVANLQEA